MMRTMLTADERLEIEIQQALEDWKAAENYLECADDPDLVEYAVFDLETAKSRYTYMLKKLRQRRENGE